MFAIKWIIIAFESIIACLDCRIRQNEWFWNLKVSITGAAKSRFPQILMYYLAGRKLLPGDSANHRDKFLFLDVMGLGLILW